LLEPQRSNTLTYSEAFDNANWSKLNVTISANTTDTLDPSGYNGADKITDDSTSAGHILYRFSTWDTTQSTASVYAKAGTSSKVCILNASTGQGVFADLSTQTLAVSPTFTGTLTAYGNGWYRITATHTAASAQTLSIGLFTGTDTYVYSGTGSYAYIWGAQLEAGAYATSYIPTLGTSVTRVADVATLATIPSSTATSFTIFVDWNYLDSANAVYSFENSASTLSYAFYYFSGKWDVYNGSGFITNFSVTSKRAKIAIVHTPSTVKVFINGANNTKAGASPSASLSQKINFAPTTAQQAALNSMLYIPSALTDSQAIELTTL
jgi:hypothetical protein